MATTESFENLVKDITEDITSRVQSQVRSTITDAVNRRITELLTRDFIEQVVVTRVNQSISEFKPDMSEFEKKVTQVTNALSTNMLDRAQQIVDTMVKVKLANLDVTALARDHVNLFLRSDTSGKIFPPGSIPANALQTQDLLISGSQITGGMIKDFSSIGIQDQATGCRLTVMDVGTVFENTLYAPKIVIKGDTVIEGDIDLKGTIVPTSPGYQSLVRDAAIRAKVMINNDVFAGYNESIFSKIATEGINIDKLRVNNQVVFEGNKMSSAIINSSLQTVGRLRDLQTQGETLLSETLYTTARRVGINTMEPSSALSIWDEEVELAVGKQSQNVARIAVQRGSKLVLGSNNKNNITLTPEGVAEIPQLKLGNMVMGSSATTPNYDAPLGTVLFNENPSLGGPLGWVSLGSSRWANFGIID